jgi:hypothetical protein
MGNIKNLFEDLDVKDPEIKTSDNVICLFPNYWNYSFVSIIICIVVSVYVLIRQNDEGLFFLFIIIILASLIILLIILRYYNTVVIDFSLKTILIKPNFILRLFIKKKNISFSDVRRFEIVSNRNIDGFRPVNRRHIITVILKNSDKIKLLSSDKYSTAEHLSKALDSSVVK